MIVPITVIKDIISNKDTFYGVILTLCIIGIPALGGIWRLGKLDVRVKSIEDNEKKTDELINTLNLRIDKEINQLHDATIRHEEAIKYLNALKR